MPRPLPPSKRPAPPPPRRTPLVRKQRTRGARPVLRADPAHAPPAAKLPGDRQAFFLAVEQAKLDAMKELAYGASHEINNPLANIAARAQTMMRRETDDDKRRMLQAMHRQAMRAHEMISDLMLFARPPRIELAPMDLCESARRVIAELSELAQERSIEFTGPDAGQAEELLADHTQVEAALSAVLTNSIEAIGSGGSIAISVVCQDDEVTIEVRDSGPGIPEEVREHLFDPFYSGREAGRGLGFGLSKCWRIVTEHGGRVVVESPLGGGALFRLVFPRGV